MMELKDVLFNDLLTVRHVWAKPNSNVSVTASWTYWLAVVLRIG
jgi:hypothetical protein